MDPITPHYLQLSFNDYLQNLGMHKTSVKNYCSDISYFFKFLDTNQITLSSLTIGDVIGPAMVNKYKDYLLTTCPTATCNRRLSSLRKFISYCASSGLISHNFSKDVINVSTAIPTDPNNLLKKYRGHLAASGVSTNTIKNYLSDTKAYLTNSKSVSSSPATIKRYESAIRKFSEWQLSHQPTPALLVQELLPSIPSTPTIDTPPSPPPPITSIIFTDEDISSKTHHPSLLPIVVASLLLLVLVVVLAVLISKSQNSPIIDPSPSHQVLP